MVPMARSLVLASAAGVISAALAMSGAARAQSTVGVPPANGASPPTDAAPGPAADRPAPDTPPPKPLIELQAALPPPTNIVYLQYGVAFTTEFPTSAGPICDNVTVPCILGPGGGIAARAGARGAGPWYIGGSYEFSKQDPQKLLRLAILQQLRGEARYYFVSGRDVEPYAAGGAGLAGYGNEWKVDTWGPTAFLGGGVEAQLTRRTVVGLAVNYRLIYFQEFVDSTGSDRAGGLSQMFGIDLVLEQRDPIFTGR
ncbi:MAG: hypothetical protein JWP97_1996 [Labilithrix sp.]|nr:hypothetical protein [Labilithrix sp.]